MALRHVNENAVKLQGTSLDDLVASEDGSTFHLIPTGEQFVCHDGIWAPDLRLIYAIMQSTIASNLT